MESETWVESRRGDYARRLSLRRNRHTLARSRPARSARFAAACDKPTAPAVAPTNAHGEHPLNSQIAMQPGLEATVELVVGPQHLAAALGSGAVAVYSTPSMIALMENAAAECVAKALLDGQTTVGTRVDIQHLAATPPGMRVRAYARLVKVHGRLLDFEVWAEDDVERIGDGTHQRAVIDRARFEQKVSAKAV